MIDKYFNYFYDPCINGLLCWLFCGVIASPYSNAATPDINQSKAFFLKGSQLARQGKHQEALEQFRRSLKRSPLPKEPRSRHIRGTLYFYIGLSLEQLGYFAKAQHNYRQALNFVQDSGVRKIINNRILLINEKISSKSLSHTTNPSKSLLELYNVPPKTKIWIIDAQKRQHTTSGNPLVFILQPGKTTLHIQQQKNHYQQILYLSQGKKTALDIIQMLALLSLRVSAFEPIPSSRSHPPMTGLQVGGLSTGIQGVAGITTASIFGILFKVNEARLKNPDIIMHYENERKKLHQETEMHGILATVLFISGGVTLITGATLYLIGRPIVSQQTKQSVELPLANHLFYFSKQLKQ